MELEQQQTSMDAATTTPTEVNTTEPVQGADVVIPKVDVPPPQPAYTFDPKFKYTGKNGEKWGDAEGELDEPIRGLIKSKEDEEKWKKFYSKAYGFDFVADGREKARNEYTQYKTQAEPILKYAQEATKHYKAGDLDSFFEVLGVPHEKIQQYVYQKLQQQELPADQRQLMEQNKTYQKQLAQYQEQMSMQEQNFLQVQRETLYNELQGELSKPDIASIKESFDARNGAGSFEEEVRQRGHLIYTTQNGRVAKPSELVQEIVNKYGLSAPTPQAAPNQVTAPKQVPTIPVVSGGGSSPVKKRVSSIADIENEYSKL